MRRKQQRVQKNLNLSIQVIKSIISAINKLLEAENNSIPRMGLPPHPSNLNTHLVAMRRYLVPREEALKLRRQYYNSVKIAMITYYRRQLKEAGEVGNFKRSLNSFP